MPQRSTKTSPHSGNLDQLLDDSDMDLGEAIRRLPKSPLSFRIPPMHAVALDVICRETGLKLSEVCERLLCAGIANVIGNKEVPAFEDRGPVRLSSAVDPDKGAA